MTVKELIEALQQAQAEMGDEAPIYLLIDNEIPYDFSVKVFPKGDMGPGSVLLAKVPFKIKAQPIEPVRHPRPSNWPRQEPTSLLVRLLEGDTQLEFPEPQV